MILFHGSIETIEHPKIPEQQRLLDFGKGFYLTSSAGADLQSVPQP